MIIEIYPKKIFSIFLKVILFLLFAHILTLVSEFYFHHDYVKGLIPLFNLGSEQNIPTLYSSFALILSSMLLLFIALTHKRLDSLFVHWLILAIIFLYLSIDEIAMIHERLNIVRELLNTSGLFYFAWVIPYGIAMVIFVIAYLKFLLGLPKNIMILFIVSGAIFVTGAIGFDMLAGWQYGVDINRWHILTYRIYQTCEEFFEMLGVVIFIYALLLYITTEFKFLTVTIKQ